MGQTIYIVTSGQYSSYCINAVFSDKALADEYVKRHNELRSRYEEAEIEEWELDPMADELRDKRALYTVWLYQPGARIDIYVELSSGKHVAPVENIETKNNRRYVYMTIKANDIQHAKKIATEMRTIWLTQGIEAIGGVVAPATPAT